MGTIVASEAEHFGKLAADWWDARGSSAMLHKLNPARLGYIREAIDRHWSMDETERRPLDGKTAIDVGCGAGLLTEPLARLGAEVTGVDAAAENIAAANDHAAGQGLAIDYRHADVSGLPPSQHDLVVSMEVIEHVADPARFIGELAKRLAPGGLMILSTPNRTMASRILLVEAAERLGMIPPGTHDWDKFVTPQELTSMLEAHGLEVHDLRGLAPVPGRGFAVGENVSINYLLTATRREP